MTKNQIYLQYLFGNITKQPSIFIIHFCSIFYLRQLPSQTVQIYNFLLQKWRKVNFLIIFHSQIVSFSQNVRYLFQLSLLRPLSLFNSIQIKITQSKTDINKQMNMVTMTNFSKSVTSRPTNSFISMERQSLSTRRDSIPRSKNSRLHFAKKDTFQSIHSGSELQPVRKVYQHNASTDIRNKQVYDSTRDRQLKEDWKILTLKQIKTRKEENSNIENDRNSQRKSSQKLFVSLSKKKKDTSVSKQKRNLYEPLFVEKTQNHATLKYLTNRRQILDKIQLQLQEQTKTGQFFCS